MRFFTIYNKTNETMDSLYVQRKIDHYKYQTETIETHRMAEKKVLNDRRTNSEKKESSEMC